LGGGGGRPVWWVRESTGERSAGGRHHCAAPHERVVAVAGGQARATDGTVNWQHGFGKDAARFGEEERGRLGALDSRTCRRRDCLAAEPRRKRSSSRGAGRRGEASSFLALARSLVVRNSGSFCAWGLVSYVCAVGCSVSATILALRNNRGRRLVAWAFELPIVRVFFLRNTHTVSCKKN